MILFRGIGASKGRASGAMVLDPDRVTDGCVLVRTDLDHDDSPAMKRCAAIVTTRGGITGDAAIVARTLGKPCVVSCANVRVDYTAKALFFMLDGKEESVSEGEVITVDGAQGTIERT